MPAHGSFFLVPLSVVYSVNEQEANLFTKCGSPAIPVAVTCTINSGIVLDSSSTANPGLLVPAFPAGSTILLVNLGHIYGRGGRGGNGGDVPNGAGVLGFIGGDALEIHHDVSINNGSGEIFGAGSGGRGGSAGTTANGPGAGGGQGSSGGQGGNHGSGGLFSSGNGTAGSPSSTGNAGTSVGDSTAAQDGRAWGIGGSHAILLNGFSATFLSGNDSTHVKGLVS